MSSLLNYWIHTNSLNTLKPEGKQEVIFRGCASVPVITTSAGSEGKCPHYY